MTELDAKILGAARAKKLMIATAESCTGGMIAARLTDLAGSSDIFDRGFVTYSNDAKMDMLGIDPDILDKYGAVSEETARAMAQGALIRSGAGIAISVTGIAGPGGSDHKPEGRVCFGLATADGVTTETVEFGAIGRDAVRQATTQHALTLIAAALDAG